MEKVFQVDAFTLNPFKGNPAGVVLLSGRKPDDWMQSFAREMNLSETAFLINKQGGYLLRWFTPKVEVDLCGHATLASAHVLFCLLGCFILLSQLAWARVRVLQARQSLVARRTKRRVPPCGAVGRRR